MSKEIITQVMEKYNISSSQENRSSFRSRDYLLTEALENEFLKSNEKNDLEKTRSFEEILRARYQQRGFEKEDIETYLRALSNGDFDERKKIILKTAVEFERNGKFLFAAEEYFEAGEKKKAAEVLIKGGRKFWSDGNPFVLAAMCLVESGADKEKAYLEMSEELKKLINMRKKKSDCMGGSLTQVYIYLGDCLHEADKKDEALKAYMDAESGDEYEKLKVARDYLTSIGEWKRAAEFKKKLIDYNYDNWPKDYFELAEYYRKAGMKKEEAEALWSGGDFLGGAQIAFELTKNKKYFLKAAEAYRSIRPERLRNFRENIWDYFDDKCYKMHFDESIKRDKMKMLNRFHELFVFVYSAYSLPLPKKISYTITDTIESHKKIAEEAFDKFKKERETVKGVQLKNLLSDSTLVQLLERGILGGASYYDIEEIFKYSFKGFSCPKPVKSNLIPDVQKLWEEAIKEEKEDLGYDPVEMAGRAYEKAGHYKEARERYLKAGFLSDAKRMEELVKNN